PRRADRDGRRCVSVGVAVARGDRRRSNRDVGHRGGRAVPPGRWHLPLRESAEVLDPARARMSVEIARGVGPDRLDIAYERSGDSGSPPVLLLMGLGTQMLGWPDGFCGALVGQGLHVIRSDNRDIGLSSHVSDAPAPDLASIFRGDTSSASYTLSDMAGDTVGLLDALGLESAHLVGASMGGMIAQTLAIEHPGRVRSLTS